ncbi:hypothetical protein BZY71_22730 [Leclercia adecarboxylata]|nr:hypothetical protein BZY71_22730 [Leclercia adecarboxylata]
MQATYVLIRTADPTSMFMIRIQVRPFFWEKLVTFMLPAREGRATMKISLMVLLRQARTGFVCVSHVTFRSTDLILHTPLVF